VRAYHTEQIAASGYLDRQEFVELKKLADRHGIALTTSDTSDAKPVYVLRPGPDCDDCKEMDNLLVRLSDSFQPVVLPMMTKEETSGNFLTTLAHVYCSENPGNAWLDFISSITIPAEANICDDFQNRILDVFVLSVFAETHTGTSQTSVVIAPNGAYHIGGIGADASALEEWLTVNANRS